LIIPSIGMQVNRWAKRDLKAEAQGGNPVHIWGQGIASLLVHLSSRWYTTDDDRTDPHPSRANAHPRRQSLGGMG
jgi:hypothetical protein